MNTPIAALGFNVQIEIKATTTWPHTESKKQPRAKLVAESEAAGWNPAFGESRVGNLSFTCLNLGNLKMKTKTTKSFTQNQAKAIGEQLGIQWDRFDVEQFRAGLRVELEHGTVNQASNVTDDDPLLTVKIAFAHLAEFPDYYTRLAKMEAEAKSYWESKAIKKTPSGSKGRSGNRRRAAATAKC